MKISGDAHRSVAEQGASAEEARKMEMEAKSKRFVGKQRGGLREGLSWGALLTIVKPESA
jgi:hypothetical protein